ncbi:MAG: hypothetical protein WA843_00095, partial [Candidatus Saccharimonadales bacterium]
RNAKKEVEEFLEDTQPTAKFVIPSRMGVTFLSRSAVNSVMRSNKLLEQGFGLQKVANGIKKHKADTDRRGLEVPIEQLGRSKGIGNKLVWQLSLSPQRKKLATQAKTLKKVTDSAGGPGLPVLAPNHIAVCQFKQAPDGKSVSLHDDTEAGVAGVIASHFRTQGIGFVVLNGLVLGKHYNIPMRPDIGALASVDLAGDDS